MLIQKKIKKEKLAIYIIVIVVMIGGTIFSVYKNYSLGRSGGAIVMEAPAGEAGASSSNYNLDNLLKNISIVPKETGQLKNVNIISPAVEANKSSDLIDLSLLSESKFKMLKENTFKSQRAQAGKNNPFASY